MKQEVETVARGYDGCSIISPDGWLVLYRRSSGSGDNSIGLWDQRAGQEVKVFSGHRDWANRVAFLPDGRRFVSAGREGAAVVWDIEAPPPDPDEMRADFAHADPDPTTGKLRGRSIEALAVSPDGRLAVTGDAEGYAYLWEIPDPGSEETTLVHDFPRLLSADEPTGTSSYVEHAATGIITEFKNDTRRGVGISGAAFSPDGRRVFLADAETRVRVFDVESGQELARQQQPEWRTPIRELDVSADGRWLLMGSSPYPQLWQIGADRVYLLKGHQRPDPNRRGVLLDEPGTIHSVAFATDGTAVTLGADGMVRRWVIPGTE